MVEAEASEWTGEDLLDLRESKGLSYTDLANRTGLPRSTVYHRVQRADDDGESPDERVVRVYLPSASDRARWQREAEERGLSLSALVRNSVETELTGPDLPDDGQRLSDLQARLDDAQDAVQRLQRERDRYRKLLDVQEDELESLREQGTTPTGPTIRDTIHPGALEYLREHGRLRRQDLPALGIDPDTQEAADVANQMETLERLGVVEATASGWSL